MLDLHTTTILLEGLLQDFERSLTGPRRSLMHAGEISLQTNAQNELPTQQAQLSGLISHIHASGAMQTLPKPKEKSWKTDLTTSKTLLGDASVPSADIFSDRKLL